MYDTEVTDSSWPAVKAAFPISDDILDPFFPQFFSHICTWFWEARLRFSEPHPLFVCFLSLKLLLAFVPHLVESLPQARNQCLWKAVPNTFQCISYHRYSWEHRSFHLCLLNPIQAVSCSQASIIFHISWARICIMSTSLLISLLSDYDWAWRVCSDALRERSIYFM